MHSYEWRETRDWIYRTCPIVPIVDFGLSRFPLENPCTIDYTAVMGLHCMMILAQYYRAHLYW
jgi:hypothetical protein